MSGREELLAALGSAGREHGDAEVGFHTALSERMGLSAVEQETLALLERGPRTAGELAARTGLAPASVTGLIDRLVRKGFVRRATNEADRRRVNVELAPDQLAAFDALRGDLVARYDQLYAGYTDAELELILDFVRRSTEVLDQATVTLADSGRS